MRRLGIVLYLANEKTAKRVTKSFSEWFEKLEDPAYRVGPLIEGVSEWDASKKNAEAFFREIGEKIE